MEQKLLVKDSEDALIHELSQALLSEGVTEGADCYYISDGYGVPFFKIPKAFKKEDENDPDFYHVFIDVEKKPGSLTSKEFSVYGSYHHEHFTKASDAAICTKQLLTGVLCEVALVIGHRQASLFMLNTGDPKANVDGLMSDFENIYKQMSEGKPGNYHFHTYYTKTFPYYLLLDYNPQKDINQNAYALSSILAEHPEFYILG